jgi:hypothetical protein
MIRDRDGEHRISSDGTWPPTIALRSAVLDEAGVTLLAHRLPSPTRHAPAAAAPPGPDPEPELATAAGSASGRNTRPTASAPRASGTPRDPLVVWRRARLLRGNGHYPEALRLLEEVASGSDDIWAPIALVDAMRINAANLSRPTEVVRLGGRFLARFSDHELAPEATALLGRAHEQLGDAQRPEVCTD